MTYHILYADSVPWLAEYTTCDANGGYTSCHSYVNGVLSPPPVAHSYTPCNSHHGSHKLLCETIHTTGTSTHAVTTVMVPTGHASFRG